MAVIDEEIFELRFFKNILYILKRFLFNCQLIVGIFQPMN